MHPYQRCSCYAFCLYCVVPIILRKPSPLLLIQFKFTASGTDLQVDLLLGSRGLLSLYLAHYCVSNLLGPFGDAMQAGSLLLSSKLSRALHLGFSPGFRCWRGWEPSANVHAGGLGHSLTQAGSRIV